jgi:hypothetical protein
MKSINRIAQLLAVFVGIIGMYFTAITLITINGALQAGAVLLILVTLPMLIVGVLLLVFSYRAIFKPTESSNRHIAAIYSIIVLLYSDILIEPLISNNRIIVNPKVVASGSSIILAIIVYYGIRMLLNKTNQEQVKGVG